MRVREGEVDSLEQSRDVLWQGVQGMQGGQATLKLLFEQGVGTERPESAGRSGSGRSEMKSEDPVLSLRRLLPNCRLSAAVRACRTGAAVVDARTL